MVSNTNDILRQEISPRSVLRQCFGDDVAKHLLRQQCCRRLSGIHVMHHDAEIPNSMSNVVRIPNVGCTQQLVFLYHTNIYVTNNIINDHIPPKSDTMYNVQYV